MDPRPNAYRSSVVENARRKHQLTEIILPKEYYSDDDVANVDSEIDSIENLPTTSDSIHKLENLKRIRTVRRWFNQWFENDLRTDCRQFVKHTNHKFYWPWFSETVIVDTLFIDIFPDGTVTKKLFQGNPFLIDTAESHYSKVTGRNTLKKLERLETSDEIETIIFDKLM